MHRCKYCIATAGYRRERTNGYRYDFFSKPLFIVLIERAAIAPKTFKLRRC